MTNSFRFPPTRLPRILLRNRSVGVNHDLRRFCYPACTTVAARRLRESGRDTSKQVALRCGFANADTLCRALVDQVDVTPAEYCKHYARA